MRNISIGQILVLIIICFLLFGDFKKLKKKGKNLISEFTEIFYKNKKKGT